MQNNHKPVVLIMMALSLLLGLSLGQNHRQHTRIQQLQAYHYDDLAILTCRLPRAQRPLPDEEEVQADVQAAYEALRAAAEQIHADRDELLRELHQEVEKLQHVYRNGL
ncbi:MAG TPA: hypothetical protein PKD70_14270 [Saprospiraceae bacterium]|nr:hypothetical protein [Saprospiraceae bacterium]